MFSDLEGGKGIVVFGIVFCVVWDFGVVVFFVLLVVYFEVVIVL